MKLDSLMFAIGCGLLVYGLAMAWLPLGYIAAGLLIMVLFGGDDLPPCPRCGQKREA
jgi:hypothetical protein